jgi:hypothetical protein
VVGACPAQVAVDQRAEALQALELLHLYMYIDKGVWGEKEKDAEGGVRGIIN